MDAFFFSAAHKAAVFENACSLHSAQKGLAQRKIAFEMKTFICSATACRICELFCISHHGNQDDFAKFWYCVHEPLRERDNALPQHKNKTKKHDCCLKKWQSGPAEGRKWAGGGAQVGRRRGASGALHAKFHSCTREHANLPESSKWAAACEESSIDEIDMIITDNLA